jgi:hypothetical protein
MTHPNPSTGRRRMFGVVDEGVVVVVVALTVVAVDGAVEDEDGGEASKVRWCIGLVLLHAATTTVFFELYTSFSRSSNS